MKITPSRREMLGLTATGLLLPTSLRAATATVPTVPLIAPFVQESATVRDARFGKGLTADYRAILPLGAQNKRVWLDTQAKSDGDGKSAATAFKSEAAAYKALLCGDQLMIASGSVLLTAFGELKARSGRDSGTPTVLQSYDRNAPADEGRYGLLSNRVTYRGDIAFMKAVSGTSSSFFAFRGIRFDHSAGVGREYPFTIGVNWLLIEQCAFIAAQVSLNSNSGSTVHVLRQCAFQGSWAAGAHAQGVYTSGNFDTVIEDCVFHHSGWKMDATRSSTAAAGGPTMFNHGLYAAVKSGGVLRRSVFIEPASHGAQLRGNWKSHDNVFIDCPLALLHGNGTNYAIDAPGGVMAHAYRNIVSIAEDITPALGRGFGIEASNTRVGSVIEQNLVAGPGAMKARSAFAASAETGANYEPNPTFVTFRNNTNAWSTLGYNQGSSGKSGWPNRVFVAEADNITPADKVAFADPTRDGLSAAKSLGYSTIREFGNAMAADPTKAWASKIAAHILPGYVPVTAVKGTAGYKGAVLAGAKWNSGDKLTAAGTASVPALRF